MSVYKTLLIVMDECVGDRYVLAKIGEEMRREDFRCLSYLSKDFISNRKRKELKSSLDLFLALEEKTVIQCKGGDFSFLVEAFKLMQRNDIVRMLSRQGDRHQLGKVAADTFHNRESLLIDHKRKLLFKVGDETGRNELQRLNDQLSRCGVGKRALDHVTDVWDALDLLEEKVSDAELLHCLRTVYEEEHVQTILNGFIDKGRNISLVYSRARH